MDTARHIIDECKRIATKTPSLDNYCVYWPRDDEEDRSGLFLDPERPLGFYQDLSSVRPFRPPRPPPGTRPDARVVLMRASC